VNQTLDRNRYSRVADMRMRSAFGIKEYMKKPYIIVTAVIYAVLISGVFYYSAVIKPKLGQTPVERGLISKEGAAPRIRISQKILHNATESASNPENLDIRDGETALELIKRTHPTETKDYDFGTLVESIDGVKNGTDNKYWILYINGKQATVGAGAYTIQKNDAIEWRFEAYAE
jgi:hypothetical protein